jgi:hypothetical protein
MAMDKETKKGFEDVAKEMNRLAAQVNSLTDSSGKHENRLNSLEGEIATVRDSQQTPPSGDSSHDDPGPAAGDTKQAGDAAALQDEVARLQERNAFLESEDHQNEVIEDFLRKLDADNFSAIGIKLGFLETSAPEEAELAALQEGEIVEVPLADGKTLKMTARQPENIEGWEHSETHGLYIRID